jgi:starch synthase
MKSTPIDPSQKKTQRRNLRTGQSSGGFPSAKASSTQSTPPLQAPAEATPTGTMAPTPKIVEPDKPDELARPPSLPEKQISEEHLVKDLPAIEPPKTEPKPETPPPPRRMIPPMFVVMIASELAPVAKVGGLGDVVFGLSRELELRGDAVEIILPKYNNMRYDQIWGLTKTYENLMVPWFGGAIPASVWFGFVHGRKCFFIDPHSPDNFFNRGVYYGQNDDVMRFAFFCRAALEFMFKTGKHPEIIHCHDWQTALVPVLLWEIYQHLGMRHPRVCFTVHNFRHQGVTGAHVLRATGLNRPEYYFHYDRLRDNANPHALNLMKGGIVYSNFVTTVSPRHAWEAKDAGQGHGLEPTLHIHQGKYGGVINGLDYDQFNPETDPHIPVHYNATTIEKKYDNKRALRNRFWLADNAKPIIAFIGRLDAQKGLELVRHAIFYALNHQAQFVLLGNSPERGINDHFLALKHHLNNSPDCHLEIGYHEELAHLIYAGADMVIVPSRYEPCGLAQLIALRYGAVPVVRSVGGLVDTVFDKDYSNRPLHERNGYVFQNPDNSGIESALHRAIRCYYDFPDHFRHLMLNGMRCDYSWNHPGQDYLNIYDYIRDK